MKLSRKTEMRNSLHAASSVRKQNIQLEILDSQVYAKWMKNLNLISHAMYFLSLSFCPSPMSVWCAYVHKTR